MLALGIVLLATIVSNTVPAKHALIQNWPYSFRFSLAATWGDPVVMTRVWSGAGTACGGHCRGRVRARPPLGQEAAHRRAGGARHCRPWRRPAAPGCGCLSGDLPQDPGAVRHHFHCQRLGPVCRELRGLPRPPGQGRRRHGQELCQAAGGHADRTAYRQAYRRRLLPLAHLRHSRYRHAGICRQALPKRTAGMWSITCTPCPAATRRA